MSQYPPPPPSYGAYDQPPPPGFGYPPGNQGPYYPQPGYPQPPYQPGTTPATVAPGPGGYYPGQPATQTIDETDKAYSPKKEREDSVQEMNVFTVEGDKRKYIPRIPMLHSSKYKPLENEQNEAEDTAAELSDEKRKPFGEDFVDEKSKSIATKAADDKNESCTVESSDNATAPELVEEKYLPSAPELDDLKHDSGAVEWASDVKCKPTAPKLDNEMYPLISAGELSERKLTSISNADELTVRTFGHGKFQFTVDELMYGEGLQPSGRKMVDAAELSHGNYQFTDVYPPPEMGRRSSSYSPVDTAFGVVDTAPYPAVNYGYPSAKVEDNNNDDCNCTDEDCRNFCECCQCMCYCLMCIFHMLEALK